jgi:hypothetical protein
MAGLAVSDVAGQQVASASKFSDRVSVTPSRLATEPNQTFFWSDDLSCQAVEPLEVLDIQPVLQDKMGLT